MKEGLTEARGIALEPFEALGTALEQVHALAQALDAAQLLDHLTLTSSADKESFRVILTMFSMIVERAGDAECLYRYAATGGSE